MQIRSAAKWIAAAAGILVGAVIVGFTLKDTTYIEAKLEQIKGARQSVTAVEKTTAKTQKMRMRIQKKLLMQKQKMQLRMRLNNSHRI